MSKQPGTFLISPQQGDPGGDGPDPQEKIHRILWKILARVEARLVARLEGQGGEDEEDFTWVECGYHDPQREFVFLWPDYEIKTMRRVEKRRNEERER